MCLATPTKIKSRISKSKYKIDNGTIIDTVLIPDLEIGDWVLCHANLAINKIDAKEAKEILKLNNACTHNGEKYEH